MGRHPLRSAGWVAPAVVLATVALIGALTYGLLGLRSAPEPMVPVPPMPSASAMATEVVTPGAPTAPAVPHGNGGEFLTPGYEQGVREFEVLGQGYSKMVGASTDLRVVAVRVGNEVRGIDASTTQTVWSFPSYACSQGSWNGVALCVDDGDRGEFFRTQIPDIVGIDLSSGESLFRFTPVGVPGDMRFIGSDDVHAYFIVTIEGSRKYLSSGQHHILALDAGGAVSWTTALETRGMIFRAALAAEDHVAIHLEETVVVLERSTGSVTLDKSVAESDGLLLTDLLWDGWLVVTEDDDDAKPYKVFDHSGTILAEYAYVDEYVPSDMTVGGPVVPVYESEVLNRGGRSRQETWAVNSKGERVAGEVDGSIVDARGNHLAEGPDLMSTSADGALFLSDLNTGSIHDVMSGKVIGGFSPKEKPGYLGILDGIVFEEMFTDRGRTIFLLLPGPG